jgi:hypothetical protein
MIMDFKTHARYQDTKELELLCGKKAVPAADWVTDRWSPVDANEITCSECHANIHRFTVEEFDEALEELMASSSLRR